MTITVPTPNAKAVHVVTGVLAVTGFVLSISDKIEVISGISPQVAKYWPQVLALAAIVDRAAKLFLPTETPIVEIQPEPEPEPPQPPQ